MIVWEENRDEQFDLFAAFTLHGKEERLSRLTIVGGYDAFVRSAIGQRELAYLQNVLAVRLLEDAVSLRRLVVNWTSFVDPRDCFHAMMLMANGAAEFHCIAKPFGVNLVEVSGILDKTAP